MILRQVFGPRGKHSVRNRIAAHLGGDLANAQTFTHKVKTVDRVNLHLVLDRWLERDRPTSALIGFSGDNYRRVGLADIAVNNALTVAPIQREPLERAPGETLHCVTHGVYLLRHGGRPIAVMLYEEQLPVTTRWLDVMAVDAEVARAAFQQLLDDSQRDNVYKGKVISLAAGGRCGEPEIAIQFHELPAAARGQVVLPADVMTVLERNVLGLLHHADALRRSGRSTRHGVLLHGPPGTGKTLAVRYLASAARGHTVILLSGRQLGLIRESCQIARLLAPSIVVLEDVDLIALHREENEHTVVLHELMDEMDGLGAKTACIFLLTTNRPEVIEPALSGRPGRIDQAIAFPLPDADCRRRLFDLYGTGINLSDVNLDRWVVQTDGVSPAFIEELLRKAALFAAERHETSPQANGQPLPLELRDEDLANAVRELVFFGGEVTQRLLGYKHDTLA